MGLDDIRTSERGAHIFLQDEVLAHRQDRVTRRYIPQQLGRNGARGALSHLNVAALQVFLLRALLEGEIIVERAHVGAVAGVAVLDDILVGGNFALDRIAHDREHEELLAAQHIHDLAGRQMGGEILPSEPVEGVARIPHAIEIRLRPQPDAMLVAENLPEVVIDRHAARAWDVAMHDRDIVDAGQHHLELAHFSALVSIRYVAENAYDALHSGKNRRRIEI